MIGKKCTSQKSIWTLTFLALVLLFNPNKSSAQIQYTGIVQDNKVSSFLASYNPSSIVDSKTKFSASFHTNFARISNFSSNNYAIYGQGIKFVEPNNPGYVRSSTNVDIINLKYEFDHRNAGAYSFRFRTLRGLEGLPIRWAHNAATGYGENIFGTNESLAGVGMNRASFTEHNLTYARTIFDQDTRFLKAGISMKILNGVDASFVNFNSGEYDFLQENTEIIEMTDLDADLVRSESNNQLFYQHRGLAFDLGITYEYRPEFEKQYYEMDGVKRNVRYDINKYKWKVSASITDLGFLRFTKDSTSSYNFTNPSIQANSGNFVDLGGLDPGSLIAGPFDYVEDNIGANSAQDTSAIPQRFGMGLPTALHASFDMNILRPFLYVSYNVSLPLHFKSDISQLRGFFIQTVTPRIEKNNWSIMLPISQLGNGTATVGVAGRFNLNQFTVFLGSNNMALLYGQKSSRSRSFYGGVAYNIFYKVPDDADGDKISDPKDACPYDPGLAKFNGCPDTDGDGIIDKEDLCIYEPGPRSTRGCPDTDGDGVIDMNDMCPDVPGLGIHYGCPDRDKDGVIDAADRCPDVPGIELNNGCPLDDQRCCTDEDGDGVLNEFDNCPTVPGSVYNSGCPIDSSNINNINLQEEKEKVDANNTAEQIKDSASVDLSEQFITSKSELDSILDGKNILKDLEVFFDVDEATLRTEERLKLDNAFRVLPANEKYAVILIGHTDRDGSLDYNLQLSKRRAETVQRKLQDFYKFPGEISVYYYGEAKSIHSGDYTEELKQADRRVDVKLILLPRN
ncbi:MAG: DUF5723 family protein [Fluviicola sp.]